MSAPGPRELTLVAAAVALAIVMAIGGALLAPPADDLPSGSSSLTARQARPPPTRHCSRQAMRSAARSSRCPRSRSLPERPSWSSPIRPSGRRPGSAGAPDVCRSRRHGARDRMRGRHVSSSTATGISETAGDLRTFSARFRSPLSAGAPAISMSAGCSSPELDRSYFRFTETPRGEAVFFSRVGRGLAVWWSGTAQIENRSIEQAGHLELLLNIVGSRDREILWDEFYHGPATLALVLRDRHAAAMGTRAGRPGRGWRRRCWRGAARRSGIRLSSRAIAARVVETMAGLYARAPSAAAAVALARARLRRLLLEATGLSPSVSDARIADAAAARVSIPKDELRDVLEAADWAGSDPLTPAETALPLVEKNPGRRGHAPWRLTASRNH